MPGDSKTTLSSLTGDAILATTFDRLRPRLMAMILRRVSSKMAARIDPEGVVHDTFVRARPRWQSLSPQPKEIDAWVYGQVLDRLRELIRAAMGPQRDVDREVGWAEGSAAPLAEYLVDSQTGPNSAVSRAERCEVVRAALEKLDPTDREIWESASGRLLRTIPTTRVTCIALSPDGALVGAGDEDGRIAVWPVPGGEPISNLEGRHNRINCLSFSPDPVRRREAARSGSGWLLAAGDHGGIVTVWDLHTHSPRSFCRGAGHDVFALAFRPDRMTLASAGRGRAKLWDVATGRLLVDLESWDMSVAVAFSPNGDRLAVAGEKAFDTGGAYIWDLEDHRGIETLGGLLGLPEKVIISPDGRLVAALAQDWQVSLWDRSTGGLMHLFEAPRGSFADNAAMAFDPDGTRLAYAAGREAIIWDVKSGKLLNEWRLLYDVSARKLLATIPSQLPLKGSNISPAIGFDPTGTVLAHRAGTEVGEPFICEACQSRRPPRISHPLENSCQKPRRSRGNLLEGDCGVDRDWS
jgi:WD40 repeat protein